MKNTINNITLSILLFFGTIQFSYAVEQTNIDKNDNIIRTVRECSYPNVCNSNGQKILQTAKVLESLNAISELTNDSHSLETNKKRIDEINANYSEDFDKLENSVYEMQTVELEAYVKLINLIRNSNRSIRDKNDGYRILSNNLTSSMIKIRESFDAPFENILKIKKQKTIDVYNEHMKKEELTKNKKGVNNVKNQ